MMQDDAALKNAMLLRLHKMMEQEAREKPSPMPKLR